jgi:hypothetical protein
MVIEISSQGKKDASVMAGKIGPCEVRRCVSLLREIFGQAILVISGPGRRMYQSLTPKPEGTIFSKRSKPQVSDRTPHDATTIMPRWLNRSYEVSGPNGTVKRNSFYCFDLSNLISDNNYILYI